MLPIMAFDLYLTVFPNEKTAKKQHLPIKSQLPLHS
jgi:hypothetical protein